MLVVQILVDQLMLEQIVVFLVKFGMQIVGILLVDDIQVMVQMEIEVVNVCVKVMEEKCIVVVVVVVVVCEQVVFCVVGVVNIVMVMIVFGVGVFVVKVVFVVNCLVKFGDLVMVVVQKFGLMVEFVEVVNMFVMSVNFLFVYVVLLLLVSSDVFVVQSEVMQGLGIVMVSVLVLMMIVMVVFDVNNGWINLLILKYVFMYGVLEMLVYCVVKCESIYNLWVQYCGNYGFMQICYNIVKSFGYDGVLMGLFDVEINLKYVVKYLCGVWIVVGKNEKVVDWFYCIGYYYDVKCKGLLDDIQ